jgi:hypothetical protein
MGMAAIANYSSHDKQLRQFQLGLKIPLPPWIVGLAFSPIKKLATTYSKTVALLERSS